MLQIQNYYPYMINKILPGDKPDVATHAYFDVKIKFYSYITTSTAETTTYEADSCFIKLKIKLMVTATVNC